MADESVGYDELDRDENPVPIYVNMERKERESYLSQIGNFSTEERELFNLICDNWEEELGYAKFVTKINKKHSIEEKFLHSLMKKLRSSGSGILMTKFIRGERGVDKIILTDVRSPRFYYYFINNEFQKNYEEVNNEFVSEKNFDKYEILTNDLRSKELDLNNLNKTLMKEESKRKNIFSITPEGFETFYVTSTTFQDLIKISVRKIKYYFKSDNFIAFIAKIMNSSISKIRGILDHFEVSDWKILTGEILKNIKIINSKFKNINHSFYQAAVVINRYCISELVQKDKELEDDKKLRELLKLISQSIREKEFTPLTQENFNELFEEYLSDVPEIKERFYENYVDNKTKTGLTEIVFIGKHYIHQDNLYKVFIDRVSLASTEFHEQFIREYKSCLTRNSADPGLFEGFPFDSSIEYKLKEDYPILSDMFKRKSILAESIIHFSKKKGHSQGKMHNLLAMYFIEGRNELKSYSRIFNLQPVELFEDAFNSIHAFKRFLIFVTGRHSKYIERFTGRKKIKKDSTSKSKRSKSSNYNSYNTDSVDYPSRRKRLLKDEPVKKNKTYNDNEIEDAWKSLGHEITKKK